MIDRERLGTPRKISARPQLCSKCDARIEDAAPLMVFGNGLGDTEAWVYCRPCGRILAEAAVIGCACLLIELGPAFVPPGRFSFRLRRLIRSGYVSIGRRLVGVWSDQSVRRLEVLRAKLPARPRLIALADGEGL